MCKGGGYRVRTAHDWWMLAMTVVHMRAKKGEGQTGRSCAEVREELRKLGTAQAARLASKLG
jgi:hypothetical protein